jgi:dihydroxy-acid dehydratase
MTLDIAMGGSTNTILHLLAAAQEAEVAFGMKRHRPPVAQGAAAVQGRAEHQKYHMEDVHRAGGIMSILGELARGGLLHTDVSTVHAPTMADALAQWDITQTRRRQPGCTDLLPGRPGRHPDPGGLQPELPLGHAGRRPRRGLHPLGRTRLLAGRRPGRAARQHRPDGCVVKTAGVDEHPRIRRHGAIFESQDAP